MSKQPPLKRSGSEHPEMAGPDDSAKSASSGPLHGLRYTHPPKHPRDSSSECKVDFGNCRWRTPHSVSHGFRSDRPIARSPALAPKLRYTLVLMDGRPRSQVAPLPRNWSFSKPCPPAAPADRTPAILLTVKLFFVSDDTSAGASNLPERFSSAFRRPPLELDPEKGIAPAHLDSDEPWRGTHHP